MYRFFSLLVFCVSLNSLILSGQSVSFEAGLSKSFIPQTERYEQPNLHFQLQHRVSEKIEYTINYYSIFTYWPYTPHEITPWNGDEREIYTRDIKGIDILWGVMPLINAKSNFGFNLGPTGRRRFETGFEICQYTVGGWLECFGYDETYFDIGISMEFNYNYFIWQNVGVGVGLTERIYRTGPHSFSINGGIIYLITWKKEQK